MANAKKLSSGNYRVRVFIGTENGKKVYKSFTARTKKEAEYKALTYKQQISGVVSGSFAERAEHYIDVRRNSVVPSTILKYNNMLNVLKREQAMFCDCSMMNINNDKVELVIKEIAEKRAPKTVEDYYRFISAVIGDFCPLKVSLPKQVKKVKRSPQKAEVEAILSACEGNDLYYAVLLGSYCMMREGEICALDMSDFDLKHKTLHIHKTMIFTDKKEWVCKPSTKTFEDRVIQLPDRVVSYIVSYGIPKFPNPRAMYHRYMRLLRRNKLPQRTFHSLRHFGASYFHSLNIPLAYTQKYGGWSDINTLLEIYQEALDEPEKVFFDIFNKSIL